MRTLFVTLAACSSACLASSVDTENLSSELEPEGAEEADIADFVIGNLAEDGKSDPQSGITTVDKQFSNDLPWEKATIKFTVEPGSALRVTSQLRPTSAPLPGSLSTYGYRYTLRQWNGLTWDRVDRCDERAAYGRTTDQAVDTCFLATVGPGSYKLQHRVTEDPFEGSGIFRLHMEFSTASAPATP